jgi:hypothetical protein
MQKNDEIKFFEAIELILADPDLSSRAKLLWIYLVKSAWKRGHTFFGTSIGKSVSMGPKKLYRAQSELLDSGLIQIEKRSRGQASIIKPLPGIQTIKVKSMVKMTTLSTKRIAKTTILSKESKNSDKSIDVDKLEEKDSQNNHTTVLTDKNTKRTKMSELMDKNVLLSGQICPQTSPENQSQPSFPEPIKEAIKEAIRVPTFVGICSQPSDSTKSNPVIQFPEHKNEPKEPKLKTSKHRASREEQLEKIKANLAEYRTQYPEIDITLEIENFEYWLTNYPKGKMRKDIFTTWKNWLHREHVQQLKRKKQPKQKIRPSIHERGGFNAEAVAAYLIKNARD